MPDLSPVPAERIERAILVLRGHKVILDSDLAALYGVETKALNRAVKRNFERFPADFSFQLTDEEAKVLRFQFGTLKNIAAKFICNCLISLVIWPGLRPP